MFDSHAHVAFYESDEVREAVIARARAAGVTWLEIGTNLEQSRKAVELAARLEGIYATVGVHPSDIAGLEEDDWKEVEKLLSSEKVVAVGEVGLDYYHQDNRDEQLVALRRLIDLASQKQLPVVFHVRSGPIRDRSATSGATVPPQAEPVSNGMDAHDDMIVFLSGLGDKRPAGVIHTFSGTSEQAQKYLELGLYLSFSGVVTFKNAGEIAEVAKTMPLEKMLIETDSPFLAPEPHRGQQNEPAYVELVAKKIAELRGTTIEEIANATEQNARTLIGLL